MLLVKILPKNSIISNIQGLKAVSQKFRRNMIELSDLSETLVKSLSLLDDNENVKVKVLKLLKNLSSKSCGKH